MLKAVAKFFHGGHGSVETGLGSAYAEQARHLQEIWHGRTYGIERVFRILVCLAQFVYPTLFLRSAFGTLGPTSRKIAVEFYLALKFAFPLVALFFGLYRYPAVIWIAAYFVSETVFHILNLVFLADIHEAFVSYTRSVLLLFLNYLEVLFDFALVYAGFDFLNKRLDAFSAVYYSFVTQATLGYGDIYPVARAGQAVVIAQLVIVLLFALVFINYFSSAAGSKDGR